MDLSTLTPAQIDTALVAANNDAARAQIAHMRAIKRIEHIEEAGGDSRYYSWCSPEALTEALMERDAANAAYNNAVKIAEPLDAEFDRRGGWTRYYLVLNSNGHVHSSTHCSSCFPTTSYAWLVEQSGMTAEALVELAGESACTDCFAWAPVSTLRRASVLEAPERKAARLVREAEKAARDAKKIAKALTADGSEFVVMDGGYKERFKTEQAASQWAVGKIADNKMYGYRLDAERQKAISQIIEAMAVKHGKTAEAVLADMDRKVEAKIKRNRRGY